MRTTDVPPAVLYEMTAAGLPHPLVYSDGKGVYLAAWVIARKEGRTIPVAAAAEAAETTWTAVEHWRRRDPEFKAAERWARYEEPYQVSVPEPQPEPELRVATVDPTTAIPVSTDELRQQYERTKAVLARIGRPPYGGSKFEIDRLERSYDQARDQLADLAAEMRRRGLDADVLPPRKPAPTIRFIRSRNDQTPAWARREAR